MILRVRRPMPIVMAAAMLIGLGGCGGEQRFPVRGQLLYEDTGLPIKELAGASVTFTSEELHTSAGGIVDGDGAFQLSSVGVNDGAAPGPYRVIVSQCGSRTNRGTARCAVVDPKYELPKQSELCADVKPQANTFTFRLRRRHKK